MKCVADSAGDKSRSKFWHDEQQNVQHTIIAGICTINTVCTVNTVNRNYAVISDHQDNYVYVVINEKGKKVQVLNFGRRYIADIVVICL